MKKALVHIWMVIALVAGSIIVSYGQTKEYRAIIPFDFTIGKKHFNGGDYSVEIRGELQKVFVIRDIRGQNPYVMLATPAERSDRDTPAFLSFRHVGDYYRLLGLSANGIAAALPETTKYELDLGTIGNSKSVTVVALSSKGWPVE